MLRDGVLTRRKRLIIKLANALRSPEELLKLSAMRENRDSDSGRDVSATNSAVYTRVFEVAIVNASLSKDEFTSLTHLRTNSTSMMMTILIGPILET